ncbi:MAG: DNA recombination protein RmuC [Bacteroides sp.]|nr:MAG: DNA recombination protein RmuC [Bacteroides sp.]
MILFYLFGLFSIIIILLFISIYVNFNNIHNINIILKKEALNDRLEILKFLKSNREELNISINNLQLTLNNNLHKLYDSNNKLINDTNQNLSKYLYDFKILQNDKFANISNYQLDFFKSIQIGIDKLELSIDKKFEKTLNNTLSNSLKVFNENIYSIQKELGQIHSLASGVGDLKKILSNIKTKGILGEMQLKNILSQIMTLDQYDSNVRTKKDSNFFVEFAIKLPNNDNDDILYMPIDAKFPQEIYTKLQKSYDIGNIEGINKTKKMLNYSIKKFAKDICDKYIDPPYTTDFAIMFLPFENLFLEVINQPGIIEYLQRNYKIIVAGPTTLAAILNSLQVGFRTLRLQKRSSEVWNLLKAIKYEFEKFDSVLTKTQKKIIEANEELEKLITTRTNAIIRNLNSIEQLPLNVKDKNQY